MAADYGYVGSASLKKGLGTVTEQSAEVSAIADRRVQDDLIFLVGGNTQMFSFGYNGANIPLPNNLLCLNMILGVDVALDEGNEWNMRIQIDPGVYGTTQSLGWHQVNVPGVVAFSNIVDEDFQWFIALRADIFNFFPVIPVPGFRWQFDKAGCYVEVDGWGLAWSTLQVVVLPVLAGVGLRAWAGRRMEPW